MIKKLYQKDSKTLKYFPEIKRAIKIAKLKIKNWPSKAMERALQTFLKSVQTQLEWLATLSVSVEQEGESGLYVRHVVLQVL